MPARSALLGTLPCTMVVEPPYQAYGPAERHPARFQGTSYGDTDLSRVACHHFQKMLIRGLQHLWHPSCVGAAGG